jgi:hypothetical protein
MTRLNAILSVTAALCASSLHATITITSFTASLTTPQPLGTPVTFTATATDTNSGPLAFQYNISYSSNGYVMVSDFTPGAKAAGTWTAAPFPWTTIANEGTYHLQVVAKDFTSGQTATATLAFSFTPISTNKSFVVSPTANPLVALASAPACATGSSFQITIQRVGGTTTTLSNLIPCDPPHTMNVYAAGMLPSTAYSINYQTVTGAKTTVGPTPVTFTTGPLPTSITFPTFKVITPAGSQTDQSDQTVLHSFLAFDGSAPFFPIATNRGGSIIWYAVTPNATSSPLLTRPMTGGNMLVLESGPVWNPSTTAGGQILREIDLAGNTVQQTNIGVLQQEMLALGATDFGPCGAVPVPAPVGAACMGTMHHEAVQLPNGYTAVNVDIEKIFAPGTQGNTTGLNVDIIGDGVLILNQNLQVVWYFETFQHDSGAPQLDINRPAVLHETCSQDQSGCPSLFLAGKTGVTTVANDWLHQNCIYYNPTDGSLWVSSRNQDWIYKVDYNNGTGTGNILWRMGNEGDFTFNNINNDPWPWFSHQHNPGLANAATGELTVYDNGNTRVSPPPLGVGTGDSRGMSLTVNETNMTVTPLLSQSLGYYSSALGSAQVLSNNSYFFLSGVVYPGGYSHSQEILPTAGTVDGTSIWDLESGTAYRGWLLPSLYSPPSPY